MCPEFLTCPLGRLTDPENNGCASSIQFLNHSQIATMDGGLARTLGEKGWNVPRLKGRGVPQRVTQSKRGSWCRSLGRLRTSCAFLCVVATVPALHSERLCWALSGPGGKGENTRCLLQKAWALGPLGPAAVYVWNKLSHPELHPQSQDPSNRNDLLL